MSNSEEAAILTELFNRLKPHLRLPEATPTESWESLARGLSCRAYNGALAAQALSDKRLYYDLHIVERSLWECAVDFYYIASQPTSEIRDELSRRYTRFAEIQRQRLAYWLKEQGEQVPER